MVVRFAALLLVLLAALPARADSLVDAEWLEEHLGDPNLVVLEVRYHPHRHLTLGHIPGAVQVQRFRDLGDNRGDPLMRFPNREAFQSTLRRWGVNDDSTVVVYDDSRTALASRLVYLLELYGFPMARVHLLAGGVVGWTAFNELTREPTAPAAGSVTLKEANPALVAEWDEIYDRIVSRRDPLAVLVDARPRAQYTGEQIVHAVRGGHIPGALNIVSMDGTTEAHEWVSDEDLAALYADLPRDATIYLYCHDGFRMSLGYLQLKRLGFEDVRLYDGGWGHWGNRLSLPVVEGPKPFDADFEL